jgi:phosphohistidine phosphatase
VDLYLIRHADAIPLGEGGIANDEDRPLTDEGQAQARALAAGLKRLDVRLGMVLTSPLVRTWQTAEGFVKQWGSAAPEIRVCDELAPGVKTKRLARFLRELDGQSLALVGHMPDLAEHAAWLIGSKKAQVDFAKGGVAFIRCSDEPRKGSGMLIWLATPEWMPNA